MPLPEPDSGFVVAREDAVSFLEGKLAQLGLNDREAADFITYWAPRIRAHEHVRVLRRERLHAGGLLPLHG